MSGKRIVEETPCEHGEYVPHYLSRTHIEQEEAAGVRIDEMGDPACDGGSRRVLTEGQYVPVVRTSVLAQTYAITDDPTEADAYLIPLDALSDHTEGTP